MCQISCFYHEVNNFSAYEPHYTQRLAFEVCPMWVAKIWNALPHDSAPIFDMDLGEFKSHLDEIGGPVCDNNFSAYV